MRRTATAWLILSLKYRSTMIFLSDRFLPWPDGRGKKGGIYKYTGPDFCPSTGPAAHSFLSLLFTETFTYIFTNATTMNYSMKTLIPSDADNEEDGKPNPDDGRDIAHYTPEGVCALSP